MNAKRTYGMPEEKIEIRTRKRRTDTGPRLNDRDHNCLEWITQQYAICLDHLAILLARKALEQRHEDLQKIDGEVTQKRAKEVVRRWEQMGLVEHKQFTADDPEWVWPSTTCLQMVASELGQFRRYIPSLANLEHLYWINHSRLYVEQLEGVTWQSEREIRATYPKLKAGQTHPHTPDAIITNSEDQHVALEVELSVKNYARLDKILREYTKSDFDRVWYFAMGKAENVVKKAVGKLDEIDQKLFIIYQLDDLMTLQ
jgi:hypothetical protein